jgi:hypothetical protein
VTAWQLYRVSAGSFTQIGSNSVITPTVSQVYHILLSMSGTTISGSIDGVQFATGTDSTFAAAGAAGVYQFAGNSSTTGFPLDNFKATSL